MSKFKEIEALIATAKQEGDKFYNQNNNLAGTRYRSALQAIKALAHEERGLVTEERDARELKKHKA